MFNILSKTITPQEMLLLKSLEPIGANLSVRPLEIFSPMYIEMVIDAFEVGRPFLDAGSLKKAINASKLKLSEMLSDYSGNKFAHEFGISSEGVPDEN